MKRSRSCFFLRLTRILCGGEQNKTKPSKRRNTHKFFLQSEWIHSQLTFALCSRITRSFVVAKLAKRKRTKLNDLAFVINHSFIDLMSILLFLFFLSFFLFHIKFYCFIAVAALLSTIITKTTIDNNDLNAVEITNITDSVTWTAGPSDRSNFAGRVENHEQPCGQIKMMMSSPPPGVQTDADGLILPKKIINPCLESTDRKQLHRELKFNTKV